MEDIVYEDERDPMPPVSGGTRCCSFLAENRATTQTELAADTGIAESTISEILAGKREMNRKHIEALARHFRVNPAMFMNTK